MWPRRNLLKLALLAFPDRMQGFKGKTLRLSLTERGDSSSDVPVMDMFPTQPAELAREMVTVSHFDLKRVQELIEARPSLARASWDWGFGDWETSLGAASHMGNRAIAEYLISRGARPSLFSAAMFGQLEVVKAFIAAQAGVQRIRGPHSISLLAHARMGGEAARSTFDFLQSLGDADAEPPVPLSDTETARLVGTYVFGIGVNQQVEVTADMKMYANNKMYTYPPQLNWTRKGTMTRPLFHLDDKVFYPVGAPSVRIRFKEDASEVLMTVTDADFVLTGRRIGKAK
jgi:hypothetical protein